MPYSPSQRSQDYMIISSKKAEETLLSAKDIKEKT